MGALAGSIRRQLLDDDVVVDGAEDDDDEEDCEDELFGSIVAVIMRPSIRGV